MKTGRVIKTKDRPLGIRVGHSIRPTEILAIAKRKGEFTVTWHYRSEKTLRKCKALVKQGKMRRGYSGRGVFVFHAVEVQP